MGIMVIDSDGDRVINPWIGWPFIGAMFLTGMVSCGSYNMKQDSEQHCYDRAVHWSKDRDLGPVVTGLVIDKKITNGECQDLANQIVTIGERRNKLKAVNAIRGGK